MHVENYRLQHADSQISLLPTRSSTALNFTSGYLRQLLASLHFQFESLQIGVLNFTDKLALVKLFGEQPFSSMIERR